MTSQEWIDLITGLKDLPHTQKAALIEAIEQGGITAITLRQAADLASALEKNINQDAEKISRLRAKKHEIEKHAKEEKGKLQLRWEQFQEKAAQKLEKLVTEISTTLSKIDAEEAGKEEHSRKKHEAEKIKGLMEKIRQKK